MLHALRQSAHRTGRLLLPLLLLSWLSLVCGHCVALAGGIEAAAVGHHETLESGHDCCPETAPDPCLGGDCEHTVDAQPVPTGHGKTVDPTPLALALALPGLPARTVLAVPDPPLGSPPIASRPLFLRHCVFLI